MVTTLPAASIDGTVVPLLDNEQWMVEHWC
jgi:hypothetical protein